MNAIQSTNRNHVRILWTATGLALFTAFSYVLMAFNVLGVGDLRMDEKPAGIIYFAAGCYLLGGLLIPLRNRWLLLFGAFINIMVILFFLNMYQDSPAVMFSPVGLVSKVAQILLEVTLIYVIVVFWGKSSKNL
jgi:hypothetical protein